MCENSRMKNTMAKDREVTWNKKIVLFREAKTIDCKLVLKLTFKCYFKYFDAHSIFLNNIVYKNWIIV